MMIVLLIIISVIPTVNGRIEKEQFEGQKGYIVNTYNIVLHIINPKEIFQIINDMQNNIKRSGPGSKSESLGIQKEMIRKNAPNRRKRVLMNFVGRTQKGLLGTMDVEDRQEVEEHLRVNEISKYKSIDNLNKKIILMLILMNRSLS